MTIAVRDKLNGFRLVGFDAVAACLEPEACECLWRVPVINGMLSPHDDPYTVDDAYAYAEASIASPISWQALRQWASRFFQIYDCQFIADRIGHCDLTILCLDSSQWEISTGLESVINRLQRTFKDVYEVGDSR